MIYEIEKKNYKYAPFNMDEIVRYSGAKQLDASLKSIISSCIKELDEIVITYSVCYTIVPFNTEGKIVDFKDFKMESENLAHVLKGTDVILRVFFHTIYSNHILIIRHCKILLSLIPAN